MLSEQRQRSRALAFLTLGTLCFGTSAVLIKLCRFPAEAVASLRILIAGLVLSPVAAFSLAPTIKRLGWKRVAATLIPAALLAVHFQLWVLGMRQTTAAAGTFIFAINPVLFALVERAVFRRRIGGYVYLCLAMVVAGGVWLFIQGGGGIGATGNLLCLIATVVFVGYLLASERAAQGIPHVLYLHLIYTTGGLLALPFALARGALASPEWIHGPSYLWLAGMVALPTLVGHGSATYAVRSISPLIVSFFTLFEPILATLYALAILGESPRAIEIPSYLLFVAATSVFLAMRRRQGWLN